MTQPPVQMVLHPMDQPTEDMAMKILGELMDAYFLFRLQWLDDTFSAFHKKPPRERLEFYHATEPVFDPNIPAPILETFLDAGVYEPLVDVYDLQGNIRPPTPPQIDPMTGASLGPPMPALLGQAPLILGPYWQRLWSVDRQEALKDMRDYRDLQRTENKKTGEDEVLEIG